MGILRTLESREDDLGVCSEREECAWVVSSSFLGVLARRVPVAVSCPDGVPRRFRPAVLPDRVVTWPSSTLSTTLKCQAMSVASKIRQEHLTRLNVIS